MAIVGQVQHRLRRLQIRGIGEFLNMVLLQFMEKRGQGFKESRVQGFVF